MTLSDGDVAELARAVADRIEPRLEVRIEPADPIDPYRWEKAAWTVHLGERHSYIVASMSEDEATETLVRDLTPA